VCVCVCVCRRPPGGPVHQRAEEGGPPGAVPEDLPVRGHPGPDGGLRQPGPRRHGDAGSGAGRQPIGGEGAQPEGRDRVSG